MPRHITTRPRASRPWLAAALLASLAAPALAQPLPYDPEAEARAQRIADRVKQLIRDASQIDARPAKGTPPTPSRPAPARAAPKSAAPKPADPRATSEAASALPHAPLEEPHGRPATAPVEASNAPASSPATESEPLASVTVQGVRTGVVSLFEFEDSTAGFTLHARSSWKALPLDLIGLSDQAHRGHQALAARAPERAWLGVDLDDAVDFTDLSTLSYWLRTEQSPAPAFAIRTGTQYDWCILSAAATSTLATTAGNFTRYEVDMKSAPHACRYVDLSDVRGFFWDLAADTLLTLDSVELR